ncbi:MAG: hypothetical protein ACXWG4_07440, partial [Thermoanaerobaculia bacterium]
DGFEVLHSSELRRAVARRHRAGEAWDATLSRRQDQDTANAQGHEVNSNLSTGIAIRAHVACHS